MKLQNYLGNFIKILKFISERYYICDPLSFLNMNKYIGLLFIAATFLSCSSNLDFDQANSLKLEPVLIANLASFDVPATQFVVNGSEQTISGDLMNFEVFKGANFSNSLTRVDFFFEINNTINRAFVVNVYFLDNNNNPVYSVPFVIPAYSGTDQLVIKTEIFENTKLDLLKKTSKLAFVLTLLPGQTLNSTSVGSLKLRSSATVYMIYK